MSIIPYDRDSHFPIQNLPFGIISTPSNAEKRVASALGDYAIDLAALAKLGHLDAFPLLQPHLGVFSQPTLNAFMALGRPVWSQTRVALTSLFSTSSPSKLSRSVSELEEDGVVVKMTKCVMHLPADIGDYTDFYASKEHATNVGVMFRGKENALMPNWTRLPVGYHGRASSIVVSGTPITRPCGQRNAASKNDPPNVVYGASTRMDFELEMAFFMGPGTKMGDRIPIGEAEERIFGVVLMNDWSARDIQAWEYVPLGPFLGKNFGTTISPWVVTLDALMPFRVAGPVQDPEPLPYLKEPTPKSAYDVALEIQIKSQQASEPTVISKTNLKYLYWSFRQQVAHHSVNGCNMRPGDLLATGTISGPTDDSLGSMLELSWSGSRKVKLNTGEERTFLEDGDEVIMSGYCQGEGYRVGFGECTGKLLPAKV